MEYIDPEPAAPLKPPRIVAGEWYLQGFIAAYEARLALIPLGPAGEEYKRGYAEGLAAAQRDFFAAIWAKVDDSDVVEQPLFEDADLTVY